MRRRRRRHHRARRRRLLRRSHHQRPRLLPPVTQVPAPTGSGQPDPHLHQRLLSARRPARRHRPTPAAANTDRLAATSDGDHILGASASTGLLSDIAVNLAPTLVSTSNPNGTQSPSGSIVCPANGGPLTFTDAVTTTPLGVTAQTITGVLPTSVAAATANSAPVTAFVTYIGTGGVLPAYIPSAIQGGTGTATNSTPVVPTFTGTAPSPTSRWPPARDATAPTAPVAGVISTDNSTLFVGTSGDALVHLISHHRHAEHRRPHLGPAAADRLQAARSQPALLADHRGHHAGHADPLQHSGLRHQ